MMGARLTLESVEITVSDKGAASATVQTHLKGSVHAKKVDDTVTIAGKLAQIKVGGMEMSGASLSESLALALIDGHWVVTCAAAR